jgi:exonuclease VII small subunit
MSKLRSKNKVQNRRIEALEKRVQDLVGMNDELEMMISQYEREEVVFREVPKHLQLDEKF